VLLEKSQFVRGFDKISPRILPHCAVPRVNIPCSSYISSRIIYSVKIYGHGRVKVKSHPEVLKIPSPPSN
jgi:hypothetical protein